MDRTVRILSYFSLPTDLASEMKEWPEFVSGHDYEVDLKSTVSGEVVTVRFVEWQEDEDVEPRLFVSGTGTGTLFDRVLGKVIYALSAHSDNLMVMRWRDTPGS